MGTTRGLCLGRGRTSVAFTVACVAAASGEASGAAGGEAALFRSPADALQGDRLWLAREASELVVTLEASEFNVGRDGSWCLFANRHLVNLIGF